MCFGDTLAAQIIARHDSSTRLNSGQFPSHPPLPQTAPCPQTGPWRGTSGTSSSNMALLRPVQPLRLLPASVPPEAAHGEGKSNKRVTRGPWFGGSVFFGFFIKICLQFRCTFSNLLSQLSCSVLFNCALHDCWASRRPFSPGVQGISHAYLKILHWIVAFRRASRLKWTFENQPNIQKCQFMPKKCEWPCFGHHPSS